MRPSQLETITSPDRAFYGAVGRFRDVQTTARRSWSGIPDDQNVLAALHIVHVAPIGGTTITRVNPLDPGTTIDSAGGVDTEPIWLERPGHNGKLFRVR